MGLDGLALFSPPLNIMCNHHWFYAVFCPITYSDLHTCLALHIRVFQIENCDFDGSVNILGNDFFLFDFLTLKML